MMKTDVHLLVLKRSLGKNEEGCLPFPLRGRYGLEVGEDGGKGGRSRVLGELKEKAPRAHETTGEEEELSA